MTLRRAFIAVELTDEVRHRAAALQEQMRSQMHVGSGDRKGWANPIRWVNPQNLHFTLRFLGEIPAAQVARAVMAAREAVRDVVPFTVTIAGLGVFPSFERPQVIWAGTIDGSQALEALAARLNTILARERFVADPRRFRPHLTLGRVKDERRWGELVRTLRQFESVVVGTQHVDALAVMESQLTPDGPLYTRREQVSFGQKLNS